MVKGVANSRGKLIQGLEESIELFNRLKEVLKSNSEFEGKFENSINNIQDSILMIKSMSNNEFTQLVNNMDLNNRK